MNLTIKKIIKQFALFQSLILLVTQSQSAEIIEFFPNCEADEIDTITLSTSMRSKNGLITAEEKEEYSKSLLNKLVSYAESNRAEAVIIIGKNIVPPSARGTGRAVNPKFILEYTARLIRLCEDDRSLSNRTTPFNKEGNTQLSLGNLTIEEKTLEIPANGVPEEARTLLNDLSVSLENGVYGVSLGASYAQVQQAFGTPQVKITIGDNALLVGYGRSHWLRLLDDELVEVSTSNTLFKQELVNLIPFNALFGDEKWKLDGLYGHGVKERDISWSASGLKVGDHSLMPLWSNGRQGERKLAGFRYYHQRVSDMNHHDLNEAGEDYSWLHHAAAEVSGQTIEAAIDNALGLINEGVNDQIYIYDNHVRIYTVNGDVRQITLGDAQFIHPTSTSSARWRYRGIRQNDTLSQVISELGEPTLEMSDTLIYEFSDHSIKLKFYDYDEEWKLYKIEFNFI